MKTRQIKLRAGLTLLLLTLVLIFAVQNAALIDIQIFRWHVELPRSVILFSMLIIGFIIGWSARVIYRLMRG